MILTSLNDDFFLKNSLKQSLFLSFSQKNFVDRELTEYYWLPHLTTKIG